MTLPGSHPLRALFLLLSLACSLHAQQGTFRIAGVVVDSRTRSPLPQTTVLIGPVDDRGHASHLVTGADGRFSFDRLPPAKYSLSAFRRGYPAQGFDGHEFFATAIVAGPGQDSEHLVFRLQLEAWISGHVLDDFGEPIRQAHVSLVRIDLHEGDDSPQLVNQFDTDDLGAFTFPSLSAGRYQLAVIATPWYAEPRVPERPNPPAGAGFMSGPLPRPNRYNPDLDVAYPITFYPGTSDPAAAEPIVVRPGDRLSFDLRLHALRTLTLRVRHPAAVRPNHLQLSYVLPGGQNWAVNGRFSQDEAGDYTAVGLAPGHYLVQVDYPPTVVPEKSDSTTTYYHRARSWRQEIDLDGDADINASDVPDFVTVTGNIVVEGTPTPPRFFIQFIGQDNGSSESAIYDPAHPQPFSIELFPGDYTLALGDAQDFFIRSVSGPRVRWSGQRFHVPSGGPVSVRVAVTNLVGAVHGIALDGDRPVPGVMVLLFPSDPRDQELIRRDQSDSDGTFVLSSILPGTYSVLALRDGWNLKWRDPAVLQPFLARAVKLTVSSAAPLSLKVPVQ